MYLTHADTFMNLDLKEIKKEKDDYLGKLITEHDDVSESSAMDKLLAYMECINEEDNTFMESLSDKLDLMTITWHQPWYQMTNCLTRCFKKESSIEEDTHRTDKLTYDESELIDRNWMKFVKEYHCPNKPESFARWRNRDNGQKRSSPAERVRRFVTAYLAQGLKRTLPQVYKHFVNKYAYTEKGLFSPIEEKIIDICLRHNPTNAVMILSTILRRESRMIYNKQKYLLESKPPKRKRQYWTLERATRLVQSLMRHTNCTLKGLKNKTFSRDIWLEVEKDMEHPLEYLKHFWYKRLHLQLFVKENIKLKSVGKRIFKILKRSPYRVWTDIRWNEVVEYFPKGYTPGFLNYIALRAFKVNGLTLKLPLEELAPIALKTLKHTKNIRLKKLQLNESGQLVIVDDNIENKIGSVIKMEE